MPVVRSGRPRSVERLRIAGSARMAEYTPSLDCMPYQSHTETPRLSVRCEQTVAVMARVCVWPRLRSGTGRTGGLQAAAKASRTVRVELSTFGSSSANRLPRAERQTARNNRNRERRRGQELAARGRRRDPASRADGPSSRTGAATDPEPPSSRRPIRRQSSTTTTPAVACGTKTTRRPSPSPATNRSQASVRSCQPAVATGLDRQFGGFFNGGVSGSREQVAQRIANTAGRSARRRGLEPGAVRRSPGPLRPTGANRSRCCRRG